MMTIIDTHAHLDQVENLADALQRAHEAGVSDIVCMSVDLPSVEKVLNIPQTYSNPNIHVALGIHPGNIKTEEVDATFDIMRSNISRAKAIGETGLDFWYKWVRKDEDKKSEQRRVFTKHLELAKEFDLPIVIHSRGAWRECLDLTLESGVVKALFHWYSGPLDILKDVLDKGYLVSTSPSVAYSPQSREAMAFAPVEQMLIETDCPVTYKDGESFFQAEPKDVRRTLKALAQLKNCDEESLCSILNANARQFFGF